MERYGKTPNIFKRDPDTHLLINGEYSTDELMWLSKLPWEFTEKIDGMNMRLIYFPFEAEWPALGAGVDIRGRGDNANIPDDLVQSLLEKGLKERFAELFPDIDTPVCVYGEGYGPGIQKGGGLYSPVKSFVGFDVKIGDVWLDRVNTYDVLAKLGLDRVPIVTLGPLIKGVERVRRGLRSMYGDFYAEGLVARTPMGLLDRRGERVICKIKHTELFHE